jgi:hypothetical protein
MADFVTYNCANRREVDWYVSERFVCCRGTEKRLLQNGRREYNLVASWVEVRVDDKRRHLPTLLIDWLINAFQHATGLDRVQYSNILRVRFATREELCNLRYMIEVPWSTIEKNKQRHGKKQTLQVSEQRSHCDVGESEGYSIDILRPKKLDKPQHRSHSKDTGE